MEREILIKKLSNLIDRTNSKARNFNKKGYTNLDDMFKKRMQRIANKYTNSNLILKSGYLSKGKVGLGKFADRQLQDMFSSLSALYTDDTIGTIKKYNTFISNRNKKYIKHFEKYLSKGSFENLSDEDMNVLYDLLSNRQTTKNLSSEQVINQFALDYGYIEKEDEEEIQRIIRDYERSSNILSNFKLTNRKRGGNR